MHQEVKFVRGTISKEALCGDFEIRGVIPWDSTDNNEGESCNDPLVELFIAIRNQYRNVVHTTLLPPTRNSDGTISCHILPSCVAHYTEDLPEKFSQIANAIYLDLCTALNLWNKRSLNPDLLDLGRESREWWFPELTWSEMYKAHYDMSRYDRCNKVTETFIALRHYRKAPPANKSMILDIVEQLAAENKEEIMKLFDLQEKRTLELLQ